MMESSLYESAFLKSLRGESRKTVSNTEKPEQYLENSTDKLHDHISSMTSSQICST